MTVSVASRRSPPPRPVALVCSLAIVLVVSLIGRSWTDTDTGSWYSGLDKPAWTPPGAVFGIVWTLLYALMAVAAWLVYRHGTGRPDVRRALALYAAQLVLNLGWTAVFFGLQRPGWAVVEILVLLFLVGATIAVFAGVSKLAAWLLVPYLAWIAFATALTVAIAAAN